MANPVIKFFFNCKSSLQISLLGTSQARYMFPKSDMKAVISCLGFLPKTFTDQEKGDSNTFAESESDVEK